MTSKETEWEVHSAVSKGEPELGRFAIEGGLIRIVSAVHPDAEKYLRKAVDALNSKDELWIKTAPPDTDEDGDRVPRYTVAAQTFTREDPDFERILVQKLRENHGLKLVAIG